MKAGAGKARPRRFVTVVSGLPRSGTSLLMQMLRAGGLPVVSDGRRGPDVHNPHGYFEFELVKRLAHGEAGWVAEARGKAVKVIHALLRGLPADHDYRVILMRRPVAEVLASQRRMLAGRGMPDTEHADAELARAFERQMRAVEDWLWRAPGFRVLPLSYASVLADPLAAARAVDRFLGGGLDLEAMAAVVDASLHRQRH